MQHTKGMTTKGDPSLNIQRSGVVDEAWLAARCPPRCFLLNKDGEKIRKLLQQDEDEVWCLPLLPPHPVLLFQHRVPPAGYSPSHTAPVWAPLHKLHAVPAQKHSPVGAPLRGLQPRSGCIHLCCDIFRLPHGDLLWHGPPQAAGGQPALPWSSLWAAEESAQVPGGPPPHVSSL